MTDMTRGSAAPGAVDSRRAELASELEQYRRELTGYCYRMLGSPFEAEDAVQETMVRAWRGLDRFDGRASLRTWLYRIATNACLDMLKGRQRRARPMDLGPASSAESILQPPLPESAWIEPIPDDRVVSSSGDPADVAVERESIRLAFVAALQHLPARQRAVLLLREVFRWKADEVAELLGTTTASVNSALQRARATIATRDVNVPVQADALDESQRELLARYVEAFEKYDLDSLTSLLHDDVVQSMPPYPMWLRGPSQIRAWWLGPGIDCRGSRLVPTVANGVPAFGQWRPSGPGGSFEPWSLQVLDIEGDRITGMTFFLDTERVFPLFGLPRRP
jgi:RNA polymerase sigma-70 factor (ECF subfamily)